MDRCPRKENSADIRARHVELLLLIFKSKQSLLSYDTLCPTQEI
jgi:hypothetical protein